MLTLLLIVVICVGPSSSVASRITIVISPIFHFLNNSKCSFLSFREGDSSLAVSALASQKFADPLTSECCNENPILAPEEAALRGLTQNVATLLQNTSGEVVDLPSRIESQFLIPPQRRRSLSGVQSSFQCSTCYTLPKSALENLKVSPSDSRRVMAKQAANQKRVTQGCLNLKCFQGLSPPPREAELEESTRAWVALKWAAKQHDACQILSIGASYSRGSTLLLAEVARERHRTVTVVEPNENRFLWGSRLYGQRRLPVKMLLGASVSAKDLPTEYVFRANGDPWLLSKLREERAEADYYGFGCLAALLGSEGSDFGLVLLNGMYFASAAEWAILSTTSTVNWVALADTGTKTTSILLQVWRARDGPWEIVYEELTMSDMATLKNLGYNMNKGESIYSTSSGELLGWSRILPKNPDALRIERAILEETRVWNVVRSFALLRRRKL